MCEIMRESCLHVHTAEDKGSKPQLNLFSPQAKKEGRPRSLKNEDALALALYKHKSTRAMKKSVYDDFNLKTLCSYKTFVVSVK